MYVELTAFVGKHRGYHPAEQSVVACHAALDPVLSVNFLLQFRSTMHQICR
jgi:hypothetical protein